MNNLILANRRAKKARIGAARFGRKAILKGKRPRAKISRSMLPPARLPDLRPGNAMDPAWMDATTRVTKLGFAVVFPKVQGETCRCGCGQPTETRQWATDDCEKGALFAYWYWKGDPTAIEWGLWRRDKGICAACRTQVPGGRRGPWHGHHIVAVAKGGARLGLGNFQTLCIPCHKEIHGSVPIDKIA